MAVARRWAYPRRPLRILWTQAIWHPHTAQESAAMRAAHLSNAVEDCAGRKAGAHWRRRLPPRRARTHCSVGQASRVWGIAPTPSGGASGRSGEKSEPRRPRTEKPLLGATSAGPTRVRTRTNAPATKNNSDGTATASRHRTGTGDTVHVGWFTPTRDREARRCTKRAIEQYSRPN